MSTAFRLPSDSAKGQHPAHCLQVLNGGIKEGPAGTILILHLRVEGAFCPWSSQQTQFTPPLKPVPAY